MWSASRSNRPPVEPERHGVTGDVRAPAGGIRAAQRLEDAHGVSCAGSHRRAAGERLERQLARHEHVDGRSVPFVEERFTRGGAHLASTGRQRAHIGRRRAREDRHFLHQQDLLDRLQTLRPSRDLRVTADTSYDATQGRAVLALHRHAEQALHQVGVLGEQAEHLLVAQRETDGAVHGRESLRRMAPLP